MFNLRTVSTPASDSGPRIPSQISTIRFRAQSNILGNLGEQLDLDDPVLDEENEDVGDIQVHGEEGVPGSARGSVELVRGVSTD